MDMADRIEWTTSATCAARRRRCGVGRRVTLVSGYADNSSRYRFHAWVRALLCVAITVVAWSAASQHANAQLLEPVYGWNDGPNETGHIDEWRPHLLPSPYFETWDYWLWTDDGIFVHMQFLTSSFGFGIERQGSLRGTTVLPGGISYGGLEEGVHRARRGFQWNLREWSFAPEGFDVQFDDCFMRGDGDHFEVSFLDRTMKVEITFETEAALFRPGSGRIVYGWDRAFIKDYSALPRFRFEGRMSVRNTRHDDEQWRDIQGVGFAEHTRLNGFPFQFGQMWTGLRILRDDGLTIIYEDVRVPEEYGGETHPWLIVLLDGEIIFESYDVRMVPTRIVQDEAPPSVYHVPHAYVVAAQSGEDWVQIEVENAQLVQKDNILARVSRLLRAVLSSTMNPMDYDMTVDYRAHISIGGDVAEIAGRGWSTLNFTR